MTTIVGWFNKEGARKSVWICGDSKVSASNHALLTESGPKIFSVPVRNLGKGDKGFFDRLIYESTISVAYAGNSLVGLTFNSAFSSCMSHLTAFDGPIALSEISAFANRLLTTYVRQIGESAGERALCEVLISGYCPVKAQNMIFKLTPNLNGGVHYDLTEYREEDEEDDFFILLGADKSRIKKAIEEFRKNRLKDMSWWRAPKSVLSKEIAESINPTIGGHLQLSIGDIAGSRIFSVAEKDGNNQDYLSYLGLNVMSDFGHMRGGMIGMWGMAWD